MRVLIFILVFPTIWIGLAMSGCRYGSNRALVEPVVTDDASKHAIVEPAVTDDLMITLDRRGCMGKCPVYVIKIRSDGSVSFDGRSFTKFVGRADDKITQAELLKLVSEFEKADFFRLKGSYGDCEDTPLEVITFVQNGNNKTVEHGVRCQGTPEKAEEMIANLGRQIDAITRSKRWTSNSK